MFLTNNYRTTYNLVLYSNYSLIERRTIPEMNAYFDYCKSEGHIGQYDGFINYYDLLNLNRGLKQLKKIYKNK